MSLKFAIGGGIGLFLTYCFKNAGIIVDNQATLVGLGDIKQPTVLLALFGFLMIVVLHQLKIRGAIIISILVVTAIATALGLNEFKGVVGQILQLHQPLCKWTLKVYLLQVWLA